jgi:3-phosphoshikimate 1-carboxyvinyltransferase
MADMVIEEQRSLAPIHIDEATSPRLIDEIPILAVAASLANGTSIISGLEELRFKETDRIKAIAINLKAMGAKVEEKRDGLIIHGPTELCGATLDSFDDHRIAMAFAIAGLVAKGETTIHNSECVAISFPSFWKQLNDLCHA